MAGVKHLQIVDAVVVVIVLSLSILQRSVIMSVPLVWFHLCFLSFPLLVLSVHVVHLHVFSC